MFFLSFYQYGSSPKSTEHKLTVDGFFMDIRELTYAQFKAFVDATDYTTVAERPIDWEAMKKELPGGTLKPADSVLQPGSLIFNKNVKKIATMDNHAKWWIWKIGANWKHPEGPESTIQNNYNYPVIHIAYEDAKAYCVWAHRRLPAEAEWESAAQGTSQNTIFTWGNAPKYLDKNANTWKVVFSIKNISKDGFELIEPVKSYPSNSIGIYDMLGNVWEITSDFYNVNYYKELDPSKPQINPIGAERGYSPANVYQQEHVIKGGSFLCNASYCASFRISARMGMSPDSGSDLAGFRTVTSAQDLQ